MEKIMYTRCAHCEYCSPKRICTNYIKRMVYIRNIVYPRDGYVHRENCVYIMNINYPRRWYLLQKENCELRHTEAEHRLPETLWAFFFSGFFCLQFLLILRLQVLNSCISRCRTLRVISSLLTASVVDFCGYLKMLCCPPYNWEI